ncbi:uncharacterized protein DSM5745_00707 [Aspergillus mulundensis]|uniref:C2H2-type domain-containing protein n=1 Tax=Aspergillus mulundensis TaxID=1810919 RepID=A0A3D8T4A7_9EURO|nr:hypothetical protein DSM5745_00707 [Aspergillus mulundensis]RDW93385.1 hypothetical protein DSM5745_00707 [Aspergillus mulundensis]
MTETEEVDRQSLAQVGLETMTLFAKAKGKATSVASRGSLPVARIAAEADRFELWAVNLGLFVSGHGSLDYRVREAESISRTLLRFLMSLNESLAEVLEYGSDTDAAIDTERESPAGIANVEVLHEETDSDTDLLLDGIKDPIDRLYKLATWIRTPSSRFGSAKALCYEKADPETGVNLLETFEHFDYDYVSSLFLEYQKVRAKGEVSPSEPEGIEEGNEGDNLWEPIRTVLREHAAQIENKAESFLVSRIARANVRRRQQFAYWKRHQEKLHQHSQATTEAFVSHPEERETRVGDEAGVNPEGHILEPRPWVAPAPTITTATNLNIQNLTIHENRTEVTVSEYAPSVWKPGKEIVDFPSAPNLSPSEKFFECPYCFIMCPRALSQPKAWRAHLLHDLRPYICTYKDCRQGDQLYDRRQDWVQHEVSFHQGVFRCPEHPDLTYNTTEEFRGHLRHAHREFSNSVSGTVTNLAIVSPPIIPDRPCPVCSLSLLTATELQNHIALHLERMALFSLPRSVRTEDDDGEGDSQKANIVLDDSRDGDFDEHDDNVARAESPVHSLSGADSGLDAGEPIPLPEEMKCLESRSDAGTESAFRVGIICTDADVLNALVSLTSIFQPAAFDESDVVFHRLRFGEHPVAILCLSPAQLAEGAGVELMVSSFPCIRFAFLVSTAGGAPQSVRLGDVVVQNGSTWWWEQVRGRNMIHQGNESKVPSTVLRELIDFLKRNEVLDAAEAPPEFFLPRGRYAKPLDSDDRVFQPGYTHVRGADCTRCGPEKLIQRENRPPRLHYGGIAAGPRLMDAMLRDHIHQTTQAICFATEPGIAQGKYPCVIVQGIADYADSHPIDDRWRLYAVGSAALFVSLVLKELSAAAVEQMPTARDAAADEEADETQRRNELEFVYSPARLGQTGRFGYF